MVGEESESGSKENLPSSIFYFIRIMLKTPAKLLTLNCQHLYICWKIQNRAKGKNKCRSSHY